MRTTKKLLLTLLFCVPTFGAQLVKDINAVPVGTYSGGSRFDNAVTVARGTRCSDSTMAFTAKSCGSPTARQAARNS